MLLLGGTQTLSTPRLRQHYRLRIAVVGIAIGKNSFHIVGLDNRGAIVLRQKWSRGQVEARFANMPPCLVGMESTTLGLTIPDKMLTVADDVIE